MVSQKRIFFLSLSLSLSYYNGVDSQHFFVFLDSAEVASAGEVEVTAGKTLVKEDNALENGDQRSVICSISSNNISLVFLIKSFALLILAALASCFPWS